MAGLPCPLCCEEKFDSTKDLTTHLTQIYENLKCPLCEIRFDNLMVMIKHLERGCPGKKKPTENQDHSEKLQEESAEADNISEHEDTEMLGTLSADESADESKEYAIPDLLTNLQTETLCEEQYVDNDGQLYKRKVVKIDNLWADLEAGKFQKNQKDLSMAIRPIKKECPICSKAVKGEYGLRLHLETAHGAVTHPCAYCARVFKSDAMLKQHVAQRHSMPYSCVYCNKPFNNLLLAKKHVQCHKKGKRPKFECELCHERAHTNTEMKRHYRENHLSELQPRDAPTPIAPYKKGSLWYEWHGYAYHQTSTTRSGVQVLRCWVDGCWAEVRVPVIGSVIMTGSHTHEPHTWLKERNELYNRLRRRCMTETTPIRIIYDEEAAKYPIGAKNLPFPEPSMRLWQRDIRITSERTVADPSMNWEWEEDADNPTETDAEQATGDEHTDTEHEQTAEPSEQADVPQQSVDEQREQTAAELELAAMGEGETITGDGETITGDGEAITGDGEVITDE